MVTATFSRSIISVCFLIIAAVSGSSYGKCSTEAVSYPLPHEQAYSNSLFTATCSFRSTCRLHVSFLYKVHPPEEEKFFDVNSYYWRITRGLSFRVTLSSKGNIYSATLDIDPFTYHYFGYYKCIAREVGSAAVTQSKSFYAFGPQIEWILLVSQCFVPRAQKITAIPEFHSNSSLTVTLTWQLSVKEDPNLRYCIGSLSWKVRILKYSNVEATPSDYEVRDEKSVDWIRLEENKMSHSFLEEFASNMYYSFQVGHQEELFSYIQMKYVGAVPQVFASEVYYFGSQKPPVINGPPSNTIKLHVGSSRSVVCTAAGFPPPRVYWLRTMGSPPVYTTRNSTAMLELSNVTEAATGNYFCIAVNVIVNPPKGKRSLFSFRKMKVIIKRNYSNSQFSKTLANAGSYSPVLHPSSTSRTTISTGLMKEVEQSSILLSTTSLFTMNSMKTSNANVTDAGTIVLVCFCLLFIMIMIMILVMLLVWYYLTKKRDKTPRSL